MRCDTRPDVRVRPCDRRRPRYLLSGLVVCGACGGRYTKISANLFGCATARNKGVAVCENLRNVRRDRLEATVLDALRHHLMDPDLFREFCAEYMREINRLRGDESARRDRLRPADPNRAPAAADRRRDRGGRAGPDPQGRAARARRSAGPAPG